MRQGPGPETYSRETLRDALGTSLSREPSKQVTAGKRGCLYEVLHTRACNVIMSWSEELEDLLELSI